MTFSMSCTKNKGGGGVVKGESNARVVGTARGNTPEATYKVEAIHAKVGPQRQEARGGKEDQREPVKRNGSWRETKGRGNGQLVSFEACSRFNASALAMRVVLHRTVDERGQ